MEEHHIKIEKTARYYSIGKVTEQTTSIWVVCHGYGMLAKYFIQKFESLDDGKTVVIAPEGLHRFYWEKFTGKVVASWMTKEDRENDIVDNVAYLNTIFETISRELDLTKVKVNVLGFSQGVATVCRWLFFGNISANNLILWAGGVPDEMENYADKFSNSNNWFVLGNNDEFIKQQLAENKLNELNKKGIKLNLMPFEGRHEITEEALAMLLPNL